MWKLFVYALAAAPLATLAEKCRHHPHGGFSKTTGSTSSALSTTTNKATPSNPNKATPSHSTSTTTGTTHGALPTAAGGYVQNPSGNASFTVYTGCRTPACGHAATGYTAAMNQLSFGAGGGEGGGDACGRCFAITGSSDPYTPSFSTNWKTIVVKITDLCPGGANNEWCGQTQANPLNARGMSVHFDLCQESGASTAFFPTNRGALTGHYTEVPCSQWSGSDGPSLWNGACLAGESTANWPAVGCGNTGTAP